MTFFYDLQISLNPISDDTEKKHMRICLNKFLLKKTSPLFLRRKIRLQARDF